MTVFTARDDDSTSPRWATLVDDGDELVLFCNPAEKLGGWLYTMARPNIGTVAGGAWVWDDTAHLPWEVLYHANYTALRLPRDQDLSDITLPTGVSIKAVEPTMGYELGVARRRRVPAWICVSRASCRRGRCARAARRSAPPIISTSSAGSPARSGSASAWSRSTASACATAPGVRARSIGRRRAPT